MWVIKLKEENGAHKMGLKRLMVGQNKVWVKWSGINAEELVDLNEIEEINYQGEDLERTGKRNNMIQRLIWKNNKVMAEVYHDQQLLAIDL